ncbi:signal transduction histidine kinase [Paenibacillus baekrokdamisoli]|nr:HAMP domain-containing sensor histidine kinase [Paenibacillus baekrokdamisoli]MBB3070844.1 signal transduction histidine kinase [Paenibacillus baekrokdamisoli]
MTRINRWEIKWETDTEYSLMEAIDSKGYKQITPETLVRAKQAGAHGIWIKFVLPHISHREGLFINNLYGEHVTAYMDEQQIYQHSYNYLYGKNRLLLPIEVNDSDKTILIHVHSSMEEMGLLGTVQIGDYQQFTVSYVKEDLIDIILGCSFLIVATLMFICSIFLGRGQIAAWLSLSAVILSASILLLAYSPFLYTFYGNYGSVYLHLFDLALFTLMPSLTYFFESIFGKGLYSIIRRYRIFQVYYSSLCFFLLLLQNIVPIRGVYFFLTVTAFGITMIVQFMLLFIMSIIYAVRGNKDAVFISTGFGLFALIGTGELLWFYLDKGYYELHLWKYGLIGFICSLVILLGKRFAHSHMQIVKYSKELEMYNNRLQRSEKMEVISQLAASVAHEVRNPLQVTRGFLQLMGDFTNADKERKYLKLAIEELDRAANIITNYLTFAKPQLEEVCVLNLAEELLHVEGILLPLANQEGGKIVMNIPKDLHMRGNSSKLKQAFINIIKNSIEALQGSGSIHLWAYEEQGEAIIHIRDNGRGMEESTLKRLGEPYFSSQTKGTGLGLMVTFRIIELMEGKLEFKSNLGTGTEAIIRFPIVKQ